MAAVAKESETSLFLLSPLIPEEHFSRQLWGSLVVNPVKPTDDFSSESKKAPIDMLPKIDTKSTRIEDYGEVMKWARQGGTEATVKSIFKAYLEGSQSEIDFRNATYAEWYYMTSPPKRLEDLLANDEWAKDVLEFITRNPGKQLYFVTAMLVVAKLQMAKATGSNIKGGLRAEIPDPQTGTGLLGVKGGGGSDSQRVVAAKFVKPQILAVGYRPVEIREQTPKKTWKFRFLAIFGKKPKRKLVGQLFDVDKNVIYSVNMSPHMARGDVNFMGDDSDAEQGKAHHDESQREEDNIKEPPVGPSENGKAVDSESLGGQRIRIISPNSPSEE